MEELNESYEKMYCRRLKLGRFKQQNASKICTRKQNPEGFSGDSSKMTASCKWRMGLDRMLTILTIQANFRRIHMESLELNVAHIFRHQFVPTG